MSEVVTVPTPSRHTLECGDRSTPSLIVELNYASDDGSSYVNEAELYISYTTDGVRVEVARIENDPKIEIVLR